MFLLRFYINTILKITLFSSKALKIVSRCNFTSVLMCPGRLVGLSELLAPAVLEAGAPAGHRGRKKCSFRCLTVKIVSKVCSASVWRVNYPVHSTDGEVGGCKGRHCRLLTQNLITHSNALECATKASKRSTPAASLRRPVRPVMRTGQTGAQEDSEDLELRVREGPRQS